MATGEKEVLYEKHLLDICAASTPPCVQSDVRERLALIKFSEVDGVQVCTAKQLEEAFAGKGADSVIRAFVTYFREMIGEGPTPDEVMAQIVGEPLEPYIDVSMFPESKEGDVVAEGVVSGLRLGSGFGADCLILVTDDRREFAHPSLFNDFSGKRVRVINKGDGLEVEEG